MRVTESQTQLGTRAGSAKPLLTVAAASSFIVPSAVDMNLFPSIFAVTFFRFLLNTCNYFAILTTSEMKHLFMILPLNCFFYKIKRHLLLGRKAMTKLDSIFQGRDITLLTNVRIVKAMVFPVVMYGYES